MAVLSKCSQCKREGRYAFKEEDKICAKCKMKKLAPRLEDEDNKLSEEEKKEIIK